MGQSTTDDDFVHVQSSFTNRVAARLGLLEPRARRAVRVLLLVLITWLPLVLFSAASGQVAGRSVAVTLLRDPEVNCRFLITLPLLELVEAFLIASLSTQVRQLVSSGMIPQSQRSAFESIREQVRRWHQSIISEVILLAISVGASLGVRLFLMSSVDSTWERLGSTITTAGWWHLLISLPILYFFLLRALWLFVLWGWFLFRVSRLELELTPTHPDHAGGLGFLGWGLASFAPMAFSFSTVMSAGFAFEIYHRGESLNSLKYHLIVYIFLVTAVMHLPVLPFARQLSRSRFQGLLDFSSLVWKHDRAFDEKWIHQPQNRNQEKLLGTSDVQSLADIATCYEHVEAMGVIPFDYKAMVTLAVATSIPMLPLIGTEIPLREIVTKLGELLI